MTRVIPYAQGAGVQIELHLNVYIVTLGKEGIHCSTHYVVTLKLTI